MAIFRCQWGLVISAVVVWFGTSTANAQVDCVDTATTGVAQIECEALMALYNSTDGPNWTDNTNWDTPSNVNSWNGVTVTGGQVRGLILIDNAMAGPLPLELEDLSGLTEIDFDTNQISGSIPTVLGNLINLTRLELHRNVLTGTIPTELGDLVNLTRLHLEENQLDGPIPTQLGNLSNLQHLDLFQNQLTGSIPTSFGGLTSLTHLFIAENQLTGSIPTQIQNLSNLVAVGLRDNQLSGDVPDLSALSLINLALANNAFVFADFEEEFNAYNDGSPATFSYSPQATVDSARTESFVEGAVVTLPSAVVVNPSGNDQYQWYKDGNPIGSPEGTQRDLDVTLGTGAVTAADAGEYTYEITNTVVTGLTLSSATITVSVTAASCGDGVVNDPSEACDDGNTMAGDGCSAMCLREDGQTCASDTECATGSCNSDAVCGPEGTTQLALGRWHGGGCVVGATPRQAIPIWLLVFGALLVTRLHRR